MKLVLNGLLIAVLIGFSSHAIASGGGEEKCPDPRFYFHKNITKEVVVTAIDFVHQCVKEEKEKVTILLNSNGGEIPASQGFFDFVRTSKLHDKIKIIAMGQVASSAILILLAAEEKISLPGTIFIFHATQLKQDEPELAIAMKQILQRNYGKSVEMATGGKTKAEDWNKFLSGKKAGTAVDAQTAFEMGLVTEIRGYQSKTSIMK